MQHENWQKDTEQRMSQLLRGQDDAMQAQKQLAAAQAQLGHFQGSQKDKAYKAMMGVAGKNDKALMDAMITNWKAVVDRVKKEAEIRVEYQERIEAARVWPQRGYAAISAGSREWLKEGHEQERAVCIASKHSQATFWP